MELNLAELDKLSKEELLLMLVDGTVKYTNISKEALLNNDSPDGYLNTNQGFRAHHLEFVFLCKVAYEHKHFPLLHAFLSAHRTYRLVP